METFHSYRLKYNLPKCVHVHHHSICSREIRDGREREREKEISFVIFTMNVSMCVSMRCVCVLIKLKRLNANIFSSSPKRGEQLDDNRANFNLNTAPNQTREMTTGMRMRMEIRKIHHQIHAFPYTTGR